METEDFDDFTFSSRENVGEMQGLLDATDSVETTNPFADVASTSTAVNIDNANETDPYLISQQASPPTSPDHEREGPMLGFRKIRGDYVNSSPADLAREETVKCMISSLLFGAIVIAIFVVAFTLNPQM